MTVAQRSITVVGAGMVGVSVALELRRRGAVVTLVDRNDPGRETSYGNAGVLARSSLMPINNPTLFAQLPALLGNKGVGLRYDARFLATNLKWLSHFLMSSRPSKFHETVRALNSLIRLSIGSHLELLDEAGLRQHLSDQGWLLLYRDRDSLRRTALLRQTLAQYEVPTEELDPGGISDLEPALMPVFGRGLWVKGSYSLNDPGAIVAGYARLFATMGGQIVRSEAVRIRDTEGGAEITLGSGDVLKSDELVVCLGPWSRGFLKQAGYNVTMAYERGYHMHYSGNGPAAEKRLTRPIYDNIGGYVLSPMLQGLRLTTGVEVTDCDSPASDRQLTQAEKSAREAISLGDRLENEPWLGRRPTFPDSRPAIGKAPGSRHTYFAFGHQHIGFATGPGTGLILADLMEGRAPPIDPAPFRPERFITRR